MDLTPDLRVRVTQTGVPRMDTIQRAMSSGAAPLVALRLLTRTSAVVITRIDDRRVHANLPGRPFPRDFVVERSSVWGTDEELTRAVGLLVRAAGRYAPEDPNTALLERVLRWQQRLEAAGAELVSYRTRGRVELDLLLRESNNPIPLPDDDEVLEQFLEASG